MIFIYYFKNILAIKDIETLLNPVTEKYFDTGEEINMTSIYEEICRLEKSRIDTLQKDVARSYNSAVESFLTRLKRTGIIFRSSPSSVH